VLVDRDLRYVTVFYGTNRERGAPCRGAGARLASTRGDCRPAEIYGGGSERLEVGTLKVTFPPDHQRGQIEQPLEVFGIQLRRENPDKDVVLAEVRSYGSDLDAWAADLRAMGRKRALLYVHGFATTFETAAHTVAQISYDIDFDGLPMMYSWPSAGAVGDYGRDYDVVRLAVEPFQQFLRLAADEGELDEIHVVAHSMGNQLVGLAFREMALAGEEIPALAQLVLAAPDVDAREFESRYAPRFAELFRGVTVYVSDDDWALEASKELRSGLPRAGAAAGGLLAAVLPGIEVIDATGLPADFLDHSYFAANDSVRSDLYCLIRTGVGASERPLLDFADPSWRFKPADLRGGLDAAVCPISLAVASGAARAATSTEPPVPPPGSPPWLWWIAGLGIVLLVACGVWLTQRKLTNESGGNP
jgi:esterase/lipase superfamily enzyme